MLKNQTNAKLIWKDAILETAPQRPTGDAGRGLSCHGPIHLASYESPECTFFAAQTDLQRVAWVHGVAVHGFPNIFCVEENEEKLILLGVGKIVDVARQKLAKWEFVCLKTKTTTFGKMGRVSDPKNCCKKLQKQQKPFPDTFFLLFYMEKCHLKATSRKINMDPKNHPSKIRKIHLNQTFNDFAFKMFPGCTV